MDKYLNFLAFMCVVMLFSCSTNIYTTSISRIKGRAVKVPKVTVGRECSSFGSLWCCEVSLASQRAARAASIRGQGQMWGVSCRTRKTSWQPRVFLCWTGSSRGNRTERLKERSFCKSTEIVQSVFWVFFQIYDLLWDWHLKWFNLFVSLSIIRFWSTTGFFF